MFANPIYASLITAGCRTQILEAIASHPEGKRDVAMVATDAVYFLTPHERLPLSKNLGEWDHKERTNLALFKPGVYWDDSARERIRKGSNVSFKARGINAADFGNQLRRIDREFSDWRTSEILLFPKVEFSTSFNMVTALQAIRRGKWELAGHVSEGVIVTQDSNPEDKREGIYRDEYKERVIFRSEPYFGMVQGDSLELEWVSSTPYQKRFGMDDPWSDEYLQQYGISPDGLSINMVSWMLKGE
jgi:hypothetical protein